MTRALVALSALFLAPACASEPDTIRLLEKPDAGSEQAGCRSDDQCTADHPHCDVNDHRCVDCLTSAECAMGLVCSITTHTCEDHCASSAECAGLSGPVCNSQGACVQCASDDDCSGTTPRCDVRDGVCVQCLTAGDCNPRPCFDDCFTCLNNTCTWRT